MIRLCFLGGKLKGRNRQIPPRQVVTLGRSVRADIVLDDDSQVSALHCEIEHLGASGFVRDLGSTNGTFLNGQAIREAPLQHNDRLRLGSTELTVEFHQAELPPPVPPYRIPATRPETVRPAEDFQRLTPAVSEPVTTTHFGGSEGSSPLRPGHPEFGNDASIFSESDLTATSPEIPPSLSPDQVLQARQPRAVNPIMMSLDESPDIVGNFDDSHDRPERSAQRPSVASPVRPLDISDRKKDLGWKASDSPSHDDQEIPRSPFDSIEVGDAGHPASPRQQSSGGAATVSNNAPPVIVDHRVLRAIPSELLGFQQSVCQSGVCLFQTQEVRINPDGFAVTSLVELFASRYAIFVVLHFPRVNQDTPEGLGKVHPLFDWLPADHARQYGPVLVDYSQLRNTGYAHAIDHLWGHDGCLIFLGTDRQRLFDHLVTLIHRAVPGFSSEGGVFHFCWPSITGQLLHKSSPEVSQVIFSDSVSAVVTEIPARPLGWQAFGPQSFADQLIGCGLHRVSSLGAQ